MFNGEGGGKIEGAGRRSDGSMGPADGWDRGADRKGSRLESYPLSETSHLTRNMQTGPCLKRNNPNLSPTVFIE